MESICKFMPPKRYESGINTVNFVYETEHKSLRQPFCTGLYRVSLVTKGRAEMKCANGESCELKEGTLFFMFPDKKYRIDGGDGFMYIYISFNGGEAEALLGELGISEENYVFYNFSHLLTFWTHAIWRVNSHNSNLVTESVLLHTLSFFEKGLALSEEKRETGLFDKISEYIDNNFSDPSMSLKKLGQIFSYSEKYLSYLFKKKMSVNFSSYLNRLRIRTAAELLEDAGLSVRDVSERVGFSDPMYFTKVFKKIIGVSPAEYRKEKTK